MTTYTLPDLPYDYGALAPSIAGEIMELHHDKHHATYVKGLNDTLDKLAEARDTGDFPTINQLEKNLAFHVSGHILHSLFWTNLTPDGGVPTSTTMGKRGDVLAGESSTPAPGWRLLRADEARAESSGGAATTEPSRG